MKAKLLSLNVDKSMSFSRFQARLSSSLKSYTDDNIVTEEYEDIREVFMALQTALDNEELIIAAVDYKNYFRFKNALIQAFGNSAFYDSTVLNKIENNVDINDKMRKGFSMFPQNSTVFVSDDGFYSGFGMENGSQFILFLPIDNNRIDGILRNGVIPFFEKTYGTDKEDVSSKVNPVYKEKVSLAVSRILESESVVAVNGTKNAEVLKSCGDSVKGFNDAFVFTPHVEDKGNVNATEYTAQLAKVSLDLSAANIGACISDIYSAGEVEYICIAVASEETAIVRKLYKSADETVTEFVESAAVELAELVGEKAMGLRSVGIEFTESSGENVITADDKKPAGKKALIILGVIIAVVIALCVAFSILNKNGILESLFNKNVEPSTQAPVQDTITDEPPVVEQVKVKSYKMSDYIVRDFINKQIENKLPNTSEIPAGKPDFITVNGKKMEAREAIARMIMAEIDGDNYEIEAVKAQTVAIYTYLKYCNNSFTVNDIQISDTYPADVKSAVDSVFGQYITYDGQIAITPYHLISANVGYDMSSLAPYLKPYKSTVSPDVSEENYKQVKKISADEMKKLLSEHENDFDEKFSYSPDPAAWITISSHDSAVSPLIGYVDSVIVCRNQIDGFLFRSIVLGEDNLASLCFTLTYDSENSVFEITTYGQGYGIGMSLSGAEFMAANGDTYDKILKTYYKGISIVTEE